MESWCGVGGPGRRAWQNKAMGRWDKHKKVSPGSRANTLPQLSLFSSVVRTPVRGRQGCEEEKDGVYSDCMSCSLLFQSFLVPLWELGTSASKAFNRVFNRNWQRIHKNTITEVYAEAQTWTRYDVSGKCSFVFCNLFLDSPWRKKFVFLWNARCF